MTYTVFFRMPMYNPYKTHFQNANRYTASRFARDMEKVHAIIAEGEAKGWTVSRVVSNTGKTVNI